MSLKINLSKKIEKLTSKELAECLTLNGYGECSATIIKHDLNGEGFLNLTEYQLNRWKNEMNVANTRRLWSFICRIKEHPEVFHFPEKKPIPKRKVAVHTPPATNSLPTKLRPEKPIPSTPNTFNSLTRNASNNSNAKPKGFSNNIRFNEMPKAPAEELIRKFSNTEKPKFRPPAPNLANKIEAFLANKNKENNEEQDEMYQNHGPFGSQDDAESVYENNIQPRGNTPMLPPKKLSSETAPSSKHLGASSYQGNTPGSYEHAQLIFAKPQLVPPKFPHDLPPRSLQITPTNYQQEEDEYASPENSSFEASDEEDVQTQQNIPQAHERNFRQSKINPDLINRLQGLLTSSKINQFDSEDIYENNIENKEKSKEQPDQYHGNIVANRSALHSNLCTKLEGLLGDKKVVDNPDEIYENQAQEINEDTASKQKSMGFNFNEGGKQSPKLPPRRFGGATKSPKMDQLKVNITQSPNPYQNANLSSPKIDQSIPKRPSNVHLRPPLPPIRQAPPDTEVDYLIPIEGNFPDEDLGENVYEVEPVLSPPHSPNHHPSPKLPTKVPITKRPLPAPPQEERKFIEIFAEDYLMKQKQQQLDSETHTSQNNSLKRPSKQKPRSTLNLPKPPPVLVNVPLEDTSFKYTRADLEREPFFRNTGREGVYSLLSDLGEGAFLLRPSRKFFCTLSVKSSRKVYNIGITLDSNNRLRCQSEDDTLSFKDARSLIEYYKTSFLAVKEASTNTHTKVYLKELLPPGRR